MGIDLIKGGRIANRGNRKTKSSNAYLVSLIKVPSIPFSFIPSFQEEPTISSTRSSIKDSTNQDSTVSPSPFHASLNISPKIETHNSRETHNLNASSQSSAPSPMMSDSLMSQKD